MKITREAIAAKEALGRADPTMVVQKSHDKPKLLWLYSIMIARSRENSSQGRTG